MKKYEYITRYWDYYSNEWLPELEVLGEQGWELVSTVYCADGRNLLAFFKRELNLINP